MVNIQNKNEDSDHMARWGGWRTAGMRHTGGGLQAPTEMYALICPFFFIPLVPIWPVLQVLEGKIFALNSRKVFSPDCVQTCWDIPPWFLPSPFLLVTPSFTFNLSLSQSWVRHVCLCIPAPKIIPLQSRRKSYTGRQEARCLYGIEGSCMLLLPRHCNCAKATAGLEQKIIIILCETHNLKSGRHV